MSDSPSRHRDASPTIFDRIEALEPYVAIRLLLLQFGVAAAVGVTGSRRLDPTGSGVEGVADSGTLFSLETAARFGYPIRELVWAGDWQRIFIGAFLPPQWMLWGIAAVGIFPFARLLERTVSRARALTVYLLGALTMIYLDLLGFAGVSSGALGSLFAAAGAVWVLIRCEGLRIRETWEEIPLVAWMILYCIVPIAWIHSFVHLPTDPAGASVTPLVPSWIALAASAVTGMVVVLPSGIKSGVETPEAGPAPQPDPNLSRLVRFVVFAWGAAVVFYGILTWVSTSRFDHLLWKIEPGLHRGDAESYAALERLVDRRPEDPFPKKRLAIQHLREGRWREGRTLLEELRSRPGSEEESLSDIRGRARLAGLNLRGADERLSWRFSGISVNYHADSLRLLQDLAHAARLEGDSASLERFRTALVEAYSKKIDERIDEVTRTVEGNEQLRDREPTPEQKRRIERLRAQKLNGVAYTLAELEGDLEEAREMAREAVEILADPQIYDTLGWTEVLLGDFESGLRNLQNALFSSNGFPSGTIYYHLGAAHEGLGNRDRAVEFFRTALKLDLEWWEEHDLHGRCPDCFRDDPVP